MATVVKPKQRKKIALCGYAPNVRLTPWNDKDIEIWGLNDMPWTQPRIDVLFELHKPEVIKIEGHWEKLAKFPGPIYMQDHYDEIPTSIAYPLLDIATTFAIPGTDRPYLTCSASEMLAVALRLDPLPERIDLYGVDMQQDSEFGHQRPSCEFWLGIAYALGVKISVQGSSDLLKCRWIYGFEDEKMTVFADQMRERQKFLQNQHDAAMADEQAAKERRLQYLGAIADNQHIRARYGF